MDATFGWAGAGQQVDDYFSRQIGCSRFEMDDAFLGACFGQQQCDGIGGEAGMCQVSSNFGGAGGCSADVEGYPLAFLSSGTGVFDASLIDAALLAFSRELGDSGAVSNGAMFSSYSCTTVGNMSCGESNNYSGGSHDAEVLSPTSIMSAMSPITPPPPPFPHASSHQQAVHPKRKVPDEYTSSAAPTEPPPPTVPFPQPGCAKRRAGAAATTSICFGVRDHGGVQDPAARHEPDTEAMAQVKELIYRAAAMRPVSLGPDPEAVAAEKPRRKNVRISSDPQTVAARLRRERVSERLRVLQRLVPGGSKMDTASMLDEAASYLRFLKSQVQELETLGTTTTNGGGSSRSSASQRCNYHNSSSPGFLGFARSSNISHAGYVHPEGSNATTSNKLLH